MDIKRILFGLLLIATVVISGCGASTIESVKTQEHIGDTVTISGTVQESIKIGDLSGYTLKDETGVILVSSESLPAKGSDVRVSGTLMKDTIFDYYIKAD